MQAHLSCWLLAALLLSTVCCSAADESKAVDAAFFKIDTTACATNACPAGQYATSSNAGDCKRCLPGYFKAAAGAGCCEKCQFPLQTFNASDGSFVITGATGCGCPKGFYKDSLNRCLPCPKGSVAQFGSTSCTACQAPETPSTLRDKCIAPCPAGTMNVLGTCVACNVRGKPAANPTPGGICKLCSVGANTTNGITCDTCVTGYFNTGNATDAVCNTCAANYYNPRLWSWRMQQQRQKAPINQLAPPKMPVLCKPCPSNTTTPDDNTQGKCCTADQTYNSTTNKCV